MTTKTTYDCDKMRRINNNEDCISNIPTIIRIQKKKKNVKNSDKFLFILLRRSAKFVSVCAVVRRAYEVRAFFTFWLLFFARGNIMAA